MDPHRSPQDPALDALLDASRPPTPRTDATSATALAEIAEHARSRAALGAHPVPARRRWHGHRAAVVAGVAVLAVTGAGAAAAVVQLWAPGEPVGVFTYTLPSGAVCEERVGDLDADPAVVDAAVTFFATHDVLAEADVAGEIARMRADDDREQILTDGSVVSSAYGTAYYFSPDMEYQLAVSRSVDDLLAAELDRQGLGGADVYRGHGSEGSCPGAQW